MQNGAQGIVRIISELETCEKHCLKMSLVNGYRVKCSNYKRMGDKEKQSKAREEKLGK